MKKLAVLIATLALGLVGCHGTDQISGAWFYYNASYCFGTSATIRMGSPNWNTRLRGATYQHNANNNCEQPLNAIPNTLRVEGSFYKYDTATLCRLGPIDWNDGPNAAIEWYPLSCGNGHYYAHSDATAEHPLGTYRYGGVNTIVDPYCDGVNPGCP